ncbi:MAG: OmcA/MtrC family decaheme c-type cytochrome, partial [Firmicutes bacterium]|nr:OmcA/MtrC family decaheme c-type cytochrome [Bacillota bacterium]
MQTKSFNKLFGFLVAASVALVLVGCRGSAGQTGATGPAGPAGPVGPTGPIGPVSTPMIDASQYTADQWTALSPSVTVNKVAITNGKPEVTFTVKDGAGNIIKGMDSWTSKSATASLTSYPNFAFAVAKLVPEDATTKAPSKWVSYIISSTPNLASPTATPTRPTTDNTGTLTFDANTGTYKYAFYRDIAGMKAWLDAQTVTGANNKADLGDLTFDKTLVHRLTVQFSGNLRGTGSNTPNGVTSKTAVPLTNPVNAIFDFIPGADLACAAVPAGTDVRDVISIGKCNECHDKLAFHGGGRVEARYCAVCHTDQRKYGYAVATAGTTTTYSGSTNKFTYDGTNTYAAGDLTVMVHKIHMGTELTKTGYNYANVKFETIGYSMLEGGQKLCLKCHSNVAQADNWFNKPSRLACGSCHDGIDWATGAGHTGPHGNGGPQVNDQNCANCHLAIYTKGGHRNQDITPHNPTIAMGLKTPVYEVKSAAVSGTTATVVFKITMDGTPVTYVPAVAGVVANPLTGFTGGPSFLFAYALPQDGVTAPIDYNNLGLANGQPKTVSIASLLNTTTASTNGSMTGPDASGYYTATIINAFPAAAKLRSVSLQGYFTQNAGTWDSSGNGQIDTTDTATSPRHAVS